MTTSTRIEQLDDIHEGFSILRGNLACVITDVSESQRTLELIILAQGLLEQFPGAGLLRVKMRDGIAVPVRLTDKPTMTAEHLAALELPEPTLLARGWPLKRTYIAYWFVAELLEEISKDSDGVWVNRVDASPDIDLNYNDPNRLPKTEFDIDLVKAAALPIPTLGPVTIRADRDDEAPVSPEGEVLGQLRAGLIEAYPSADMLFVRYSAGEWEADDLVDWTGYGLRSGDPLEAETIPGGHVGNAIARLAEIGFLDSLPRDGNTVKIEIAPIL